MDLNKLAVKIAKVEGKKKQIDISQLAKGIYFVVVVSEKNRVVKKLVKF